MSTATGPFKQLRYKAESTWGTLPGASGAQLLRRKSSTLDEVRDTYGSDEIRTDQQRGTYTHGTRRCDGSISADLSPGTYKDLVAALLRRDFAAVSAISGAALTIATGEVSGGVQTYTVTRGAGSFLTDGVKEGMVIRLTAGLLSADNLNKNLFVVGVTATEAIVVPWPNGSTMTEEGPITGCTVTIPGKATHVPQASHTNKSFTFEHWFSDVSQSEVFSGCRIGGLDLNLAPSGIVEASFKVLGRGFGQAPGNTAYFTSPTAATSAPSMSAVNGVLRAGGGLMTIVTGASVKVDGAMTTGQVIGSNYTPDVFPGILTANGQLTAYFQNGALRDAFYNMTTTSLSIVAYNSLAANADFVAFSLPAIILGGASKSDGAGPVVLTVPFEAVLNAAGGAGTATEATTVWVQDSQA